MDDRRVFTKLKAIRLALGLTGTEMAELIGIDLSRYSRFENRWETRATKKTNERFIRALGEGFDFLMEPADIPPGLEKPLKRVAGQSRR